MPRYKITIEYDGTNYHGWQSQNNVKTIAGSIAHAIYQFTHQKVKLTGAGRTDSGVHAFAQVAHFDLEKDWPEYKIIAATNAWLKKEQISITQCTKVSEEFNARFSATAKDYHYYIRNIAYPTPIFKNRCWQISKTLSVNLMQDAAQILIGTHDFTSFRDSECQSKTPIKTISKINIDKAEDHFIILKINAPSFLHHQVRILTASLVNIGLKKWDKEKLQIVLDAKDRSLSAPTAPATGLYLKQIYY